MKSLSAVVEREGVVRLTSCDCPDPGPGQLLLKAAFSTLSPGTERALMAGNILPLPQRIGYSMAAHVVAVGDGVSGFGVGDAVVATAGHDQYQLVDQHGVTPVPADVDLEHAAFFNIAHTAMYAIRRSQLTLGEPALVMGQGLVGALTAQLARLAGAAPLIVVETNLRRLEIARANWADIAVNPLEQPGRLESEIDDLGLGGVPVVFEATGMRAPLDQAVAVVSERGRVMMMSTTRDAAAPDLTEALMMKGATLIGGYINSKPFSLQRRDMLIGRQWPPAVDPEPRRYHNTDFWTSDNDIRAVIELIRLGRLDIDALISHRFTTEQIPDAYRLVWNSDPSLLGGVIRWPD